MRPQHFHGQTRVVEAPADYDHAGEGECKGLPIRIVDGGCLSVWKPDAEELAKLNRGGGVVSWSRGGQPIQSIGACEPDVLIMDA